MTHEEIELSMFLSMPVADGLDAVEELLALHESSKSGTKETARRSLAALNLMMKKLAPPTTSWHRWKELEPRVRRAIGL